MMNKGKPISIRHAIQVVLQNPFRALTLARKKMLGPQRAENSSFCYAREDASVSTVIYLYNYWSENYKIEKPEIQFELLEMNGRSLGKYSVTLLPNGSAAVKVKDILSHLNVSVPFEGSVLTTISHPNLEAGRPLQMNVDYFHHHGKKVTGVHSQWGVIPEPQKELLASFHVTVTPNADTHVVVRNTIARGNDGQGIRPTIALVNHAGVRMHETLSNIPSHGMVRVNVRELFPSAEKFLNAQSGNLEISSDAVMGRCLFYHHFRGDDGYSFNHATQHHFYKGDYTYTLEEMQRMGIGPVAVGPVFVSKEKDSYLLPFVDFLGEEKEYGLDVVIFDAAGTKVVEKKNAIRMHPHAVPRISFGSMLREHAPSCSLPFEGTFCVSMHAAATNAKFPRSFHVIAGYGGEENHTEYQFDSGLFNMPTHNLSNEYQTTKVFSRILSSDDFTAMICLINPSGEAGYSKTSSTLVSVFDPSGATVGETTVQIPPHGCVFIHLEKQFSGLKEALRPWGGNGVVKVRDRTTRVVGPHFICDSHANLLAADHLVGG